MSILVIHLYLAGQRSTQVHLPNCPRSVKFAGSAPLSSPHRCERGGRGGRGGQATASGHAGIWQSHVKQTFPPGRCSHPVESRLHCPGLWSDGAGLLLHCPSHTLGPAHTRLFHFPSSPGRPRLQALPQCPPAPLCPSLPAYSAGLVIQQPTLPESLP